MQLTRATAPTAGPFPGIMEAANELWDIKRERERERKGEKIESSFFDKL